MWATGVWLAHLIEWASTWRWLLIALWSADVSTTIWSLVKGQRRVARIVIGSRGLLMAVQPCGRCEPVILLSGSVVYQRIAWLRFRFADGHHYAELLAGDARHDERWHGLQLIWHLGRDAFGHPVRP